MASVLDDVRIIEIGGALGGWCGKLLADMGASVIKVEPPEGDKTRGYPPFRNDAPDKNGSLYFWHYNTSKQSVTLDVESEAGIDLFLRLAKNADVVIDSNPPQYLDSLGLGYERVSQVAPGIVFAAISPFGAKCAILESRIDRLDRAGIRRSGVELRLRRPFDSAGAWRAAIKRITRPATSPR